MGIIKVKFAYVFHNFVEINQGNNRSSIKCGHITINMKRLKRHKFIFTLGFKLFLQHDTVKFKEIATNVYNVSL